MTIIFTIKRNFIFYKFNFTGENSLSTCTITFEDIKNKADYQVDYNSISVGTSGGAPMANYHKKDKDSSTTHSAVEEGTLIVRN